VRVLLINDYGGPFAGAEALTLALREGLRVRGHEARLLASRAPLLPGEQRSDYACVGTTSRLQPLLEAYNPFASHALRRALADFRPDVVHVSMFLWQLSPAILPRLRELPAVYHVMTYKPICPVGTKTLPDGSACTVDAGWVCRTNGCEALPSWVARSAQLAMWRRWRGAFDRIVPVSESLGRRLRENGIEASAPIRPGVPTRDPRPPLCDPPTVAYAGRLTREKGVPVLLRAFPDVLARVSDARLLVAGDGPERPGLERLAAELGIAARTGFLGHVEPERLDRALARAWVQAVPSLWDEPFGLVAPEAMMRGTAVVSSAVGGLAESVMHETTGLLVPAGDPRALADALVRILASRETAESLGAAGRERAVRDFREDVAIESFLRIYGELLAA